MVKNALAGTKKTITSQKMRWEWVKTVSVITHTKFQGSAWEKL